MYIAMSTPLGMSMKSTPITATRPAQKPSSRMRRYPGRFRVHCHDAPIVYRELAWLSS